MVLMPLSEFEIHDGLFPDTSEYMQSLSHALIKLNPLGSKEPSEGVTYALS
jgi:hypothetical protein